MANIIKKLDDNVGGAIGSFRKSVSKARGTLREPLRAVEQRSKTFNELSTSNVNQLWRLKILLNRAKSPMPKPDDDQGLLGSLAHGILPSVFPGRFDKIDKDNLSYAKKGSHSKAGQRIPWIRLRNKLIDQGGDPRTEYLKIKDNERGETLNKSYQLDSIPKNKVVIMNVSTQNPIGIVLQGLPQEIDLKSPTTWTTVRSMGRNNPFMFYTGGEDVLSFDISWYTNDINNPYEVVEKCKLLQSWVKADGYNAAPPILMIHWGKSDIFINDLWVLTNADYKLSNFQNARAKRQKTDEWGNPLEERFKPEDLRLLPACAQQKLIFKKVIGANTLYTDMVSDQTLTHLKNSHIVITDSELKDLYSKPKS